MNDVFHKTFRELTDSEKKLMEEIKTKAEELISLYDKVLTSPSVEEAPVPAKVGRPVSIAKTELESSVMWAIKGLTA
jgi:hypothetical protein